MAPVLILPRCYDYFNPADDMLYVGAGGIYGSDLFVDGGVGVGQAACGGEEVLDCGAF